MGKGKETAWFEELEDSDFSVRKKRKGGPSKLDRKKARAEREKGIVSHSNENIVQEDKEPETTILPEEQVEPPEKEEMREDELGPEKKEFLEKFRKDMESGVFVRLEKLKADRHSEKRAEIAEDKFKEGLKQISSREELISYLKSLGMVTVRAKEGTANYFPETIGTVEEVFDKNRNWNELYFEPLRIKVSEIIKKDWKKTPPRNKKTDKFPQKIVDILEAAAKSNGDRRVYNNASTPEDAKEEGQRKANKEKAEEKMKESKKTEKTEKKEPKKELSPEEKEELKDLEKWGKEFWEKMENDKAVWEGYDPEQAEAIKKIETEVTLKKLIAKSEFFKGQEKELAGEILQKIANKEI